MAKAKETRPETAATVQSAHIQKIHLNDTTNLDVVQAHGVEEFLRTSIWNFGIDLETQINEMGHLRTALGLISEVLESDECSAYAEQYGAIAIMAITFVDKLREDMEKTMKGIYAHDKRRRAICGD